MANQLTQVVNQYDVNGLKERIIIQWVDDETNENHQVIINREDMENPDSNIFDNFKTMVEKFMV
jgi:hypothetical protein